MQSPKPLTTQLTCPARSVSNDSRKAYMRAGSGAAPGSASGATADDPPALRRPIITLPGPRVNRWPRTLVLLPPNDQAQRRPHAGVTATS